MDTNKKISGINKRVINQLSILDLKVISPKSVRNKIIKNKSRDVTLNNINITLKYLFLNVKIENRYPV